MSLRKNTKRSKKIQVKIIGKAIIFTPSIAIADITICNWVSTFLSLKNWRLANQRPVKTSRDHWFPIQLFYYPWYYQYVKALQKQIVELGKLSSKPGPIVMKEYTKRIEFLKHTIDTEKLNSPYEKTLAHQQIAPPNIASTQLGDTKPKKIREIHQKSRTRYENEARRELLGQENSELRHRTGTRMDNNTDESLDAVLEHHQNTQEKIAEEMIQMAQNIKHNSIVASNILKKDTKVLDNATKMADSNFTKLKHESERLEEITNRSCSLWVWVMLAIVCLVFIMMIIFIRFFPK